MRKKRAEQTGDIHGQQPKVVMRPEGMQTMGPTLYAQLRLAVLELGLLPTS